MVIILYLGTSSACFGSPLQLISALICLIACVEGVDLIVNKNEDLSAISIYQVSQKNVPLGEVCPSPKGTFFWDTLYIL